MIKPFLPDQVPGSKPWTWVLWWAIMRTCVTNHWVWAEQQWK